MAYGGHEAKFYYVGESVYGTTPTPTPAMLGIENVLDVQPSVDPGNIKVRGIGSRDLATIKNGLLKPSLKVAFDVPSSDVLNYLAYVYSLLPYTVELIYDKSSNITDLRFTGCRSDKLTVECSVEDVIKATVDILAQNLTAGTAKIADATYTDWTGVIPFSDSYVMRGAADGSSLVEFEGGIVSDWKFNIENNLKRVPVIRSTNGNLLKYLQERHRVFTGELTCDFENKTEYYDAVNDAEFSLKFGMGAKYALFKYCKWDKVESPTKVEDLVSLKTSFTARTMEFAT
jgi:hypothetical protein